MAVPGNPLLVTFLREWMEDAQAKHNTKSHAVYKRAHESMKQCPRTFNHPSEAMQLNGIGEKIVKRLEERMIQHCQANGLPTPVKSRRRKRPSAPLEPLSDPLVPPSPSKRRKTKPYVPQRRSGAYALLLALATQPENDKTGLQKDQLIALAQPLCDSSFAVPSEPGSFYTAWKSKDTLDKHGLVFQRGRPPRYFLSDDGWECAKRIQNVEAGNVGESSEPASKKRRLEKASTSKTKGQSRSTAEISGFDEVDSAPGLLRARDPILPTAQMRNTVDSTNLPSGPRSLGGTGFRLDRHGVIDLDTEGTSQSENDHLLFATSTWPRGSTPAQGPPRRPLISPQYGSRNEIVQTPDHPAFTATVLPAGSFIVELVLDNREVRTQQDRDYISNELSKLGIKPIQRSLDLGDALWIAKPKTPTLPNQTPEEFILPHILERKRLDDLIASIKDKRFHEQKFRLQRCGIPASNVTYLIEEITLSTQQQTDWSERIASAIAETEVVNGFFVKRTQKLDDTIRYLARMAKMLETLYSARALHILPPSSIDVRTYSSLTTALHTSHPHKTFTIPLSTFGTLSSKSDTLTLRDVYLKMLMCTRGVSAAKALEIQRVWRTPRELVEAFETRQTERGKTHMVAEALKETAGNKRVGPALSRKIAAVWTGCGLGELGRA